MVSVLFDTNILIDYLNGIRKAKVELARYDDKGISTITWMEVMVGTQPENALATEVFLDEFTVLTITPAVAKRAVQIRQTNRIQLPDAIVWATAQVNHRLFISRNTKDFSPNEPGVRVPYK